MFGSSQQNSARGQTESRKSVISKKIVVLGNQGVGKTSFIQAFVQPEQQIQQQKQSTVGTEKYVRDLHITTSENPSQEATLRLNIWDTTGQERFKSLSPLYYRDADAAILMFDMTDSQTLKDINEYWLPSVVDYGPQNLVLALIGNKAKINETSITTKIDQNSNIHAVDVTDVQKIANQYGITLVRFLSLKKNNISVKKVESLFKEIAEEVKLRTSNDTRNRFNSYKLTFSKHTSNMDPSTPRDQNKKRNKGCCK